MPLVGGVAIALGSFGCVFKPALRCEGESERKADSISKLMSLRTAMVEDAANKRVRDAIATLPTAVANHFIVGDPMCTPAKLDKEEDTPGIKMCGYVAMTVRTRPELVRNITQQDGGMTLIHYVNDARHATAEHYLPLLQQWVFTARALRALNATGIMHGDVKDDNLVFAGSVLRVIDWGQSTSASDWVAASLPVHISPVQSYLPQNCIAYFSQEVHNATEVTPQLIAQVQRDYSETAPLAGGITQFCKDMRDFLTVLEAPFSQDNIDEFCENFVDTQIQATITALINDRQAQVREVLQVNLDGYGMLFTLFRVCNTCVRQTRDATLRQVCLTLSRMAARYLVDDEYATTPFPMSTIEAAVLSELQALSAPVLGMTTAQTSRTHLSPQKTLVYEQPFKRARRSSG